MSLPQVANNKRYAAASGKGFTVAEVAKQVERDCGKIDIMVHSLANGPEVTKPLLETSRRVGMQACHIMACCTVYCRAYAALWGSLASSPTCPWVQSFPL